MKNPFQGFGTSSTTLTLCCVFTERNITNQEPASSTMSGKTPTFVEKLKNLEAHVGKTIIMDCVCEGEPEPVIDWLFNGRIVRDEGRFRYMFEKGNVVGLEIKEISADDEGEYECMAFNDSGEISCKCTLTVTDPDKSVAKPQPAKGEKNKGDKRKKSDKNKNTIQEYKNLFP